MSSDHPDRNRDTDKGEDKEKDKDKRKGKERDTSGSETNTSSGATTRVPVPRNPSIVTGRQRGAVRPPAEATVGSSSQGGTGGEGKPDPTSPNISTSSSSSSSSSSSVDYARQARDVNTRLSRLPATPTNALRRDAVLQEPVRPMREGAWGIRLTASAGSDVQLAADVERLNEQIMRVRLGPSSIAYGRGWDYKLGESEVALGWAIEDFIRRYGIDKLSTSLEAIPFDDKVAGPTLDLFGLISESRSVSQFGVDLVGQLRGYDRNDDQSTQQLYNLLVIGIEIGSRLAVTRNVEDQVSKLKMKEKSDILKPKFLISALNPLFGRSRNLEKAVKMMTTLLEYVSQHPERRDKLAGLTSQGENILGELDIISKGSEKESSEMRRAREALAVFFAVLTERMRIILNLERGTQ